MGLHDYVSHLTDGVNTVMGEVKRKAVELSDNIAIDDNIITIPALHKDTPITINCYMNQGPLFGGVNALVRQGKPFLVTVSPDDTRSQGTTVRISDYDNDGQTLCTIIDAWCRRVFVDGPAFLFTFDGGHRFVTCTVYHREDIVWAVDMAARKIIPYNENITVSVNIDCDDVDGDNLQHTVDTITPHDVRHADIVHNPDCTHIVFNR